MRQALIGGAAMTRSMMLQLAEHNILAVHTWGKCPCHPVAASTIHHLPAPAACILVTSITPPLPCVAVTRPCPGHALPVCWARQGLS